MSIEERRVYVLRCDEGGCNAEIELADVSQIARDNIPPGWVATGTRPSGLSQHFCPTSVRSLLSDHLREHPQP